MSRKDVQARNNKCSNTAPRGADEVRDRLIIEHLQLVKALALRIRENLPSHVDVDDLIHAGIMGLFDAARKYDPKKQVAFATYAKFRIRGAILDSLRELDWASRDLRRRQKQVEAATRDLSTSLQREPTEFELAEKLGVDVTQCRRIISGLRMTGVVSASMHGPDFDEMATPDFPGSPDSRPDNICARQEMCSEVESAMEKLSERHRAVVSLYYKEEMTMKDIGKVLGINESRVSQIHKCALAKLQQVLTSNGIHSTGVF